MKEQFYTHPLTILLLLILVFAFATSIKDIFSNDEAGQYERKTSFVCCSTILIWLCVQIVIIGYDSWMQATTAIAAFLILFLTWKLPAYGC